MKHFGVAIGVGECIGTAKNVLFGRNMDSSVTNEMNTSALLVAASMAILSSLESWKTITFQPDLFSPHVQKVSFLWVLKSLSYR
jgi:hypothetical protein